MKCFDKILPANSELSEWREETNKHKNSLHLVLFCLETKLLFLLQQEQVKLNVFKCSLNFLGERETISVYILKAGFNSEMSICWRKECRPCAMDALRTVLCMCIKATALILQTFSGMFFPLLYTEKLSAQRCNLSFSNFFCVLQLPVNFQPPCSELEKLSYCLLLSSFYQQQLSFLDS